MSKRRLVILSAVVTALLAAYMGYDVCTYQTIDGTLGGFFEEYLNHMQRYIWSGMICGIPVIYSQMLWIETPELLVRMRERVFQQVLERSIVVSFLCALYVVVCHLAVAWAIGLEMNWGGYILHVLVRLSIFYLFCTLLLYVFLSLGCSRFFSMLIVVSLHMGVLIFALGIDFVEVNQLKPYLLPAFLVYESVGCILSGVWLYFSLKKGGICLRGKAV